MDAGMVLWVGADWLCEGRDGGEYEWEDYGVSGEHEHLSVADEVEESEIECADACGYHRIEAEFLQEVEELFAGENLLGYASFFEAQILSLITLDEGE